MPALCECGCGLPAPIAKRNHRTRGWVKGQAQRFIQGHSIPSRLRHGMTHTPEYTAFSNAKNRCTNPNFDFWKDYGGRGIEFRLASFEEFFAHIGSRPTPEHSLDRIDNDGHYEVGNIRWATREEQLANRSLTQSDAAKCCWNTREKRDKMLAVRRSTNTTPDYRARMSATITAWWEKRKANVSAA